MRWRTLKIPHDTSTPYRSQTNSKAERMNRKILDGTRTVLEQAGLSSKWWPLASQHFSMSLNIDLKEGDSSYNKRYELGHFKGLKCPFGSLIDFKVPKNASDRLTKFDKPTLPGLFLGYHLSNGGKWKGDYLVAPLVDFSEENQSGKIYI